MLRLESSLSIIFKQKNVNPLIIEKRFKIEIDTCSETFAQPLESSYRRRPAKYPLGYIQESIEITGFPPARE